ncbi:MAG: sigma 54-interacting transcriptional regulator [Planctomycetota bacterium]|nr:sigma 54-interacting transcriptional regulator [Planctomycetota bacterium]
MERLEVVEGQAEPARVAVEGEIAIGRAREATLRIFDETASRRHARVFVRDGRVILEDLGSANGTVLNGEPIQGEAVLFHGDVIEIGEIQLRFVSAEATERDTVIVGDPGDSVEASLDPEQADPALEGSGEAAQTRLRLVCAGAAVCADAGDADALPSSLLDLVVETLEPDRATVCLVEPAGGLRIAAAHPADAAPPASRTLRQRILDAGEAVLIRDAFDHEGDTSASMVRSRFRSTLAAPLVSAEGVLGFVTVESEKPGRYGPEDLRALAAVAKQAALALRTLMELSGARREVQRLAREKRAGAPEIIGTSPEIEALRAQIAKAAGAEAAVLVIGETGTGKELVARRLHAESPRAKLPFVALNCAALVEGLLESEFFGHEKGAFTDAKERRDGRIAEAGEGTLFLDEVGDLSPSLQAKLLRVLSERTYTRVGGREKLEMKCRVVCATNRDLKQMVEDGKFREDLYYRLAVVVMNVPPLRERAGDVELIAEASLERLAGRIGRRVPRLAQDAREAIATYAWPGNVRELLNVLERALVLIEGDTLTAGDLPREVREPAEVEAAGDSNPGESGLLGDGVFDLKAIEKKAVAAALKKTGGKKGRAAQLLGISWPTLNRKIRQYGLE